MEKIDGKKGPASIHQQNRRRKRRPTTIWVEGVIETEGQSNKRQDTIC